MLDYEDFRYILFYCYDNHWWRHEVYLNNFDRISVILKMFIMDWSDLSSAEDLRQRGIVRNKEEVFYEILELFDNNKELEHNLVDYFFDKGIDINLYQMLNMAKYLTEYPDRYFILASLARKKDYMLVDSDYNVDKDDAWLLRNYYINKDNFNEIMRVWAAREYIRSCLLDSDDPLETRALGTYYDKIFFTREWDEIDPIHPMVFYYLFNFYGYHANTHFGERDKLEAHSNGYNLSMERDLSQFFLLKTVDSYVYTGKVASRNKNFKYTTYAGGLGMNNSYSDISFILDSNIKKDKGKKFGYFCDFLCKIYELFKDVNPDLDDCHLEDFRGFMIEKFAKYIDNDEEYEHTLDRIYLIFKNSISYKYKYKSSLIDEELRVHNQKYYRKLITGICNINPKYLDCDLLVSALLNSYYVNHSIIFDDEYKPKQFSETKQFIKWLVRVDPNSEHKGLSYEKICEECATYVGFFDKISDTYYTIFFTLLDKPFYEYEEHMEKPKQRTI